jgi:hypothetical protein
MRFAKQAAKKNSVNALVDEELYKASFMQLRCELDGCPLWMKHSEFFFIRLFLRGGWDALCGWKNST